MSSRVALVLGASTGGIGRHVASLAAGLRRRGVEVTVIAPAATGERFDFGPAYLAVPVSAGPKAVPALRRALATVRPDVVHAHGLRAGLVAGWARPEGLPPSRTAEQVCEELGVAPGQPLVLSVGRLHPQKGYDVLIDAAARWRGRTPRPVVVIAGTGPVYLRLAAHASTARAPVLLLGHRDDVPDLLGAADLAVVTSIWEARQLFVQEALRAGVPLVATTVGGLPELVGDAAVLVPPKDVDAVDAAVTALLDDPARRASTPTT